MPLKQQKSLFDPVMCITPDAPLQDERLWKTFVVYSYFYWLLLLTCKILCHFVWLLHYSKYYVSSTFKVGQGGMTSTFRSQVICVQLWISIHIQANIDGWLVLSWLVNVGWLMVSYSCRLSPYTTNKFEQQNTRFACGSVWMEGMLTDVRILWFCVCRILLRSGYRAQNLQSGTEIVKFLQIIFSNIVLIVRCWRLPQQRKAFRCISNKMFHCSLH